MLFLKIVTSSIRKILDTDITPDQQSTVLTFCSITNYMGLIFVGCVHDRKGPFSPLAI